MLQQQVYIINTVLMILDALAIIAAGYGAFFVKYYESYGTWSIDNMVFSVSVLVVMFVNNYMMSRLRLYSDIRPPSIFNLLWSIFKAVVIDFAALSFGIFLFKQIEYSRLFLISFAALSFVFIAVIRILSQLYLERVSKNDFNARKILVIGNLERGRLVSDLLDCQLSWGHEVIGTLGVKDGAKDAPETIGSLEDLEGTLRTRTVDEVVFALDGDRNIKMAPLIDTCRKMGVPIRILPALWNPGDRTLAIESCQDVPFLTMRTSNFNAAGLMYKRILDMVGGLVGTLIFLIYYPFVAVAIKRDSPGPVLFKQKRMGKHGRIFNLYKFRSMYVDAEQRRQELMKNNEMNGAIFKMKDDPRITRVGRWLRKTSIDELPQFLNVLRGEMSLVGTRPPMIEEVEQYQPEHLKRISAKPGITGLWQVSGRNKITDFEQVVNLDCQYLESWRFLDDIKILFKTVWAVLQRKGAI